MEALSHSSFVNQMGTAFFLLAIIHTFFANKILSLSHRFEKQSFMRGLVHWLGEIEVVFGLWATVFFLWLMAMTSASAAIEYQASLSYTEPLFVFVIMVVASTRPVLWVSEKGIAVFSSWARKIFRTAQVPTDFFSILLIGTLAGSFITEPAAMTVTALMLKNLIVKPQQKLMYFLLAVLFVNISIGGALTHFAAPPIIMVAQRWNWDFQFVFFHFGWKAALAVLVNSLLFAFWFRKDLLASCISLEQLFLEKSADQLQNKKSTAIIHLVCLALIVFCAHHPSVFMALFVLFLGYVAISKDQQSPLRLKESLLVAYFLAGIIFFGAFQKWWLQPLLASLSETWMFFGSVALTAVTDNAALTYLGSQVEGLEDTLKYALVAGAISGGGLTLIANAPNAAGYSLLCDKFQDRKVSPTYLFSAAVIPTVIAIIFLWVMPF
jgi:hypothetical protein